MRASGVDRRGGNKGVNAGPDRAGQLPVKLCSSVHLNFPALSFCPVPAGLIRSTRTTKIKSRNKAELSSQRTEGRRQ